MVHQIFAVVLLLACLSRIAFWNNVWRILPCTSAIGDRLDFCLFLLTITALVLAIGMRRFRKRPSFFILSAFFVSLYLAYDLVGWPVITDLARSLSQKSKGFGMPWSSC